MEAVNGQQFSVISPHAGFAVMKLPAVLNSAYERSPSAEGTRDALTALRAALKNINPANYRGIDRCPLCESPIPEPGWAGVPEHEVLDQRDVAARLRMLDFVGTRNEDHFAPVCCVVPIIENARELIKLVDSPEQYEIVRLSQSAVGDACVEKNDLGFDVGYWGSDSYSIICDSAVWPRWHGPDEDAFEELAKRLAALNAHCLFDKYDEAVRFRIWYRQQVWAETEGEPDEFCIIKVEAVCAK